MSDAADRLVKALADVINEAVELAIARQEAPGLRTSMTPRSQAHLRNMKIKGTTRYTPPPGERPGDPVDEEIRQTYEEKYGEPAPKTWGETPRLIPIVEAAKRLGISRSTCYQLVNDGRLKTVKIGARRLVPVSAIEQFINGAE
jgi:excisionase family DNA binding protein